MKKLFLILAAAAITLNASSQTKELDNLNKRLTKSDEAIADAKKAGLAATWIDRADALLAASNAYTKELIAGFSIEQSLNLIGEEPKEVVDMEVGGKPHKKYVFENYDIYVDENGSVAFWNTKNEFRPNALNGAFEALQKAYELDPSTFSSKGYIVASNVLNQFNTNGMNLYSLDQKGAAADMFVKAAETNQMLGTVDSVMIYYAGVAYNEAGNYDKALEYLNKAREIGYDQEGTVDSYIAYIQQQQGKNEDAIATLEAATLKYPGSNQLITQLIDLYVQTKRDPEKVVATLDKAKALDPNNGALYMLEGTLWEQMGNAEKAEAAFLEATKVDPNNYIGYMNAGIMKARKGDALVQEAQKLDINDVKGYNALIDQAIPFYDSAIELLEKAHELNPKEIGVVEMLKGLYYQKQQDGGPEMEAKFKEYNDLLKQMQGE
ncbi:tetratricopeptide repeat protein [Millionella massiliensis]|uniref:tetratricopeptide repeat protein n=1 Tax=Millionella massiliensis TaxID=1871023 RepID=UPI0023A7A9B0|nr:tetratricopeptide repeat protein [Millionella massiliensis]